MAERYGRADYPAPALTKHETKPLVRRALTARARARTWFDAGLERPAEWGILAGIVLIAALLRFYKLGAWSFWGDEISTLDRASGAAKTVFGLDYGMLSRPSSLFFINAAVDLLGVNEWSARLVPAIIGIASVPILYCTVRRMLGWSTALVSVLLLALAPWHLYWSQNARYYTALLLLYSLALFAFYFALECDRPLYMLLSLILLAFAVRERFPALLLVPVCLSYVVLLRVLPFEKPRGLRWRNLVLFFGPLFAIAFVFALPYLLQPARWQELYGVANNSPFWVLAVDVYWLRVPTICFAAAGAAYLLVLRSRPALLLSLGAVVPIVCVMLVSLVQYSASRYVFITLTCWLVLAAVAATELLGHVRRSGKFLAIGALAVLLVDALGEDVLYAGFQNGNREDWRLAMQTVSEDKLAGDLVVVADTRPADYYLREPTLWMQDVSPAQLEASQVRVWLVEDKSVEVYWPALHAWLNSRPVVLVADDDIHASARNFKLRVYLYTPPHV